MSNKTVTSRLTLGWRVNPSLAPIYWLDPGAKPGGQPEGEMIEVPAKDVGNHTVIIAQSGSGKSFFLGRLVEEIILKTKARCIILDPNGDFRKVSEVQHSDLWEKAYYDLTTHSGKLPHEASREEFESQWKNVPIQVRTHNAVGRIPSEENVLNLKVPITSLSVDFIVGSEDPVLHSQIYHCHAFVQVLSELLALKFTDPANPIDLSREAATILTDVQVIGDRAEIRSRLTQLVKLDELAGTTSQRLTSNKKAYLRSRIENLLEHAMAVTEFVSNSAKQYYFAKVQEYKSEGILLAEFPLQGSDILSTARVEVIDLPSLLQRRTRLLVVNAILNDQWNLAKEAWFQALQEPREQDDRVPTFVVVDEAHNIIPAKPLDKADALLREQFRSIVAEGRKYGIFLIAVSQRPDKLDPFILSECRNKAISRIASRSILKITRKMLDLGGIPNSRLDECLHYKKSRVLLAGAWAPETSRLLYCAARRTVEGGRNLRAEHWASPILTWKNTET